MPSPPSERGRQGCACKHAARSHLDVLAEVTVRDGCVVLYFDLRAQRSSLALLSAGLSVDEEKLQTVDA